MDKKEYDARLLEKYNGRIICLKFSTGKTELECTKHNVTFSPSLAICKH